MEAQAPEADTLLFVDDEIGILNSLRRELHDWSRENSLKILTAPSAKEGLAILEEKKGEICLIVSDLRMPEMKGSDFLLLAKEKWPEVLSILLTGFSETQEVMKAVQAGIFSYILKPWEPDYLKAELDKAIALFRLRKQNEMRARMIEEELRWAGEMQRAILRPSLTTSDGVEFRTSYRPMPGLYCGGDYYDVLSILPGRFLMLLGDVAGHGVKAAFITGILKAVIYPEYIRSLQNRKFSPAAFLSWLNERMNFELRRTSGLIITFFAGLIDCKEMTFTYANAGQDHPFIVSNGIARELPVSGSGLGFANSVMYTEKTETLEQGDIIFAFTDGLVEPGAKTRGKSPLKLAEILNANPYGPEFHKRILEAALEASGVGDFEDDVAIVTARMV
jgi:sigma-B regulation protein RsbU (phosphoserine phosphatase)